MRAICGVCDGCGEKSVRLSFHADPFFEMGKYFCPACMMLGAFTGPYQRACHAQLESVATAGVLPDWFWLVMAFVAGFIAGYWFFFHAR